MAESMDGYLVDMWAPLRVAKKVVKLVAKMVVLLVDKIVGY